MNNDSLSFLRKDTLSRLEWYEITEYLSRLAVFPHTKKSLAELEPWIRAEERDFYFAATAEVKILTSEGSSFFLEPFDFSLFDKSLSLGALLSPQALFQILIVLKLSFNVSQFFKNEPPRAKRFPTLFQLSSALKQNLQLFTQLQKSVDGEGNILSTASAQLQSARHRLENAKRKIVEHLEEFLKKSHIRNALQESLWMIRDGRYVLPVRADRKGDVEGIPRGVSQSGSTIFIEPHALDVQHSELEKAQIEVELEEQRVIKDLSHQCYLIHDDILKSAEVLTQIDEISARTQLAHLIVGVRPVFVNLKEQNSRFSLLNAKHPLFLLENKNCVANDLELADSNVWVLSGPNAGGKTVAMKTVGIMALMAKAGLFVSCEKAEILDFENIFVELGDRQNREEDLSTFSGHLAQIRKITELANERSLILLDEGFVGTDPAIGVAMARATLEYLAEKNSTVIITTHFSSLKTLADGDGRFFNTSMEFEPHKLMPTYKILNGIPGQSYAIELAERMGINMQILQKSREYFGSEAQRMENILKDLQKKRIELAEEIEAHAEFRKNLEAEINALKNEKEKISEIRNDLVESYRNKLQKRLNAYENRLDIRERQFERNKESLLKELREQVAQNTPSIESAEIENKPVLYSESGLQAIKSRRGTPLNIIEKNSEKRAATQTLNERAEKFRPPRQMTKRSFLDEAQASIEMLNESFDEIENDFFEDIAVIADLGKKSEEKAQSARDLANKIPVQTGHKPNFWQPQMKVKTKKFTEVGRVLRSADGKGFVECQFGVMKVKIPSHELMLLEEFARNWNHNETHVKRRDSSMHTKSVQKKITKQTNAHDPEIVTTFQHSNNTIDLRGKNVDEALDKLDLELDKMNRNAIVKVVIIHGHGMGRIKEGVRKYLEECSYGLRFRPGQHGEGGDGVTIVEFNK